MEVHEEAKPATAAAPKKQRGKYIAGWIISILVLVVFGVFTGVWLAGLASEKVTVPPHLTERFAQPIYLPEDLPGNYKIMEDSFTIQEDVLIFQAKDGAGGTIVFTEQKKPTDVDFEDFYVQQFNDAETLDNVPFPSVAGKSKTNDSSLLSIVTGDTWIIASSRSPISTDDLEIIAKSVKVYDAK